MFGSLACCKATSSWAGLTSVPTTEAKCLASSRVPCPEPQPTSTASSKGRPFWQNIQHVVNALLMFDGSLQWKWFSKEKHLSHLHVFPGSRARVEIDDLMERSCTSSRKKHAACLQTGGRPWWAEAFLNSRTRISLNNNNSYLMWRFLSGYFSFWPDKRSETLHSTVRISSKSHTHKAHKHKRETHSGVGGPTPSAKTCFAS